MKIAALWPLLLLLGAQAHAQSPFDGFDPGANQDVYALAVQSDGKILVGGTFTTLGGGATGTITRNYIGRLNPDGTIDASFNPGANGFVTALTVQADGKILVGGQFTGLGGGTGTTMRNYIGRLNADGTLDTTFNPGANGSVRTLAVQLDGKIVVGGSFTGLGGGSGTTVRNRIGRLNADGSIEAGFDPGANSDVITLAVQADGKIVVGGAFFMLGGGGTGTTTRDFIGRLNADGSLDTNFNPGANVLVDSLVVQVDGKILIGGQFSTVGGGGSGTTSRSHIARLNPDGTVDSFNPGANNLVLALTLQPDGKILAGGSFTLIGGTTTRNRIARFNPDGTLDVGFNPGADNFVRAFALQADGKILVGGAFTTLGGTGPITRSRIGRLYADGSLDGNFIPGANGSVDALAIQPDGKILVGGDFNQLGGGGMGISERRHIGRINPDGLLDASFNPGANVTALVNALAVQRDGKILVGGSFFRLGGGTGTSTRNNIGRLNPDGSVDMSFDPGANNLVVTLAAQADEKILVGGQFTALGGGGMGTTARSGIGRLNSDGTIDANFNPGANGVVEALAVQADGKILVGGLFTALAGSTRNHIGRLNADGTLDASFDPGADDVVNTIAIQADGRILVGGNFTILGSDTRNHVGRLNADGALDTSFDPGANGFVITLGIQTDGKILIGGQFTALGGGGTGTTARFHIGRLNLDGTLDVTFDPGANSDVYALAMQADGKVLAAGVFTALGGGGTTTRNNIGRLTNTDIAFQELTVDPNGGPSIIWSRSSASPEVDRVTFELSTTSGGSYVTLANPTRIPGGWRLQTVQGLPTQQNIFLRARGFYSTGGNNASGSIIESVRNAFITFAPIPSQIVSRKVHGGAGPFDITLPLTGTPGIECRSGGATNDYQVVFTFASSVTFNSASVTAGAGTVSSTSGSGTATVTVNLTGVTNAQRITVTLLGVSDGTNTGDLGVQMGVLIGDTNGNRSVNSSDVSQTKLQSGQAVTASNFREDVNVNGSVNSSDVSLVKSKSGTALP